MKKNTKINPSTRNARIIRAAARAVGYDSGEELALVTGMEYQALMRRISGKTEFRLGEISKLREVLALNPEECAALCGDPMPCRFERGYKQERGNDDGKETLLLD